MRIEMQLVKGSLLRFCGVAYVVRNKKVAAMMVKTARPVWSARPRPGGYSVVSLVDDGIAYADRQVAELGGPPGMAIPATAYALSGLYFTRLEEACRSRMASRKAGS